MIVILLLSSLLGPKWIHADEGMWLVHLIGPKTYANMQKRGLTLSKDQLYAINKSSLKDAIAIFGGGCTSEMVSSQGLLFTNHHCGYDAIASASSLEHNYLKDGFWAKSKDQEIPCPGLSVQFLIKIEDVTAAVKEKLKEWPAKQYASKLPGILMEMQNTAQNGTEFEVRISSFFKGNQFLQFTYLRYKDVRLVGTPPENIGKFGGDTDNWEWPRHTGDFSIFRVYTTPDGKASEYNASNIPFVPKHVLPVSLKGYKDGDYAMIYGYPGSTNRYETSYGVQLKTDIENPTLVSLRDARLKFMYNEMVKDPKVKIQLASSYAGIANYWKFFDGESKQLIKHKVFEKKQSEEEKFKIWAKDKREYDSLFNKMEEVYRDWRPYSKSQVFFREGIMGSPLISFAAGLKSMDLALSNPKTTEAEKENIRKQVLGGYERFINAENIASDKNILAYMLKQYVYEIEGKQTPGSFYQMLKSTYGPLQDEETYRRFVKNVFEQTMLLNKETFTGWILKPDTAALHKDPAYKTARIFLDNYQQSVEPYFKTFNAANFALNHLYQKGILEQKKGQEYYPDANFTMRISYGNVKSYSPKDAVKYSEVCTTRGILEKYKPGDYEFDAPTKLIDLIQKRDFGIYADSKHKDVVVSFITTNDITGGNSGSPVLNAKGELIGLAFDGNYEALSHKIAFDADLNRTICLDVRYLLFVVDKLGGATNIIQELQLKN